MNDGTEPAPGAPPTRASDADRDRAEARLQHHYAVGRLTLPELEERVAVAYAARTCEQLDTVLGDLPAETAPPARPARAPAPSIDSRLLLILLCCSPPAALVYWLVARRSARRRRAAPPRPLDRGTGA